MTPLLLTQRIQQQQQTQQVLSSLAIPAQIWSSPLSATAAAIMLLQALMLVLHSDPQLRTRQHQQRQQRGLVVSSSTPLARGV